MIAFGPVPSRRLGRSLGINNIPPKHCTYSCVYCQLGRTPHMTVDRQRFYDPMRVHKEIEAKVHEVRSLGETVDYLTFVPDGEPTLDVNLGREIELVQPLGIRTAVITTGALIWREDVRQDLMKADWVSLKVDSTRDDIWRRTDRPRGSLQLSLILEGMLKFAAAFSGELVTETMLVSGLNDSPDALTDVAQYLKRLNPSTAWLSIPTRPPAENWVHSPDEQTINRAYQILSQATDRVEYLIGYEGNAFAATGDIRQDLLDITAVHPMRRDAVDAFLRRAGVGWQTVQELISAGQLTSLEYEGREYYMRRLHRRHRQ